MSTIKSDNSDLTINASGSTSDIKFQANGVEKAVIDSSGNVGIGVTPEGWESKFKVLQIGRGGSVFSPDNNDELSLGSNIYTNTSGLERYINTDTAATHTITAGTHQFKVAPSGTADSAISWTTAMTIDNSGRVLINTTSTSSQGTKLIVTDSLSTANQSPLKVENIHSSADRVSTFNIGNSSGGTMLGFDVNNVGKGSISTNSSSTSYNTSSDYRLKENIVPMTGSIDRLKTLNPSRFNFIADADKTVDGFLAHEAQEVVPEAITGTKDAMMTEEYEVTPAVMDGDIVVTEAVMGEREVEDYQGIDQSKLVPLLVASLQEAVARIEVLEAQLNA